MAGWEAERRRPHPSRPVGGWVEVTIAMNRAAARYSGAILVILQRMMQFLFSTGFHFFPTRIAFSSDPTFFPHLRNYCFDKSHNPPSIRGGGIPETPQL